VELEKDGWEEVDMLGCPEYRTI